MSFAIHDKLVGDCEVLGEMPLCTVLLMRDHRFPWTILVPRLPDLRDFHDLPRDRALELFDEVGQVSRALVQALAADKINVAALGNQVPQLHVHVIARYTTDAAWPGPVWNAGAADDVDADVISERAKTLRRALGL